MKNVHIKTKISIKKRILMYGRVSMALNFPDNIEENILNQIRARALLKRTF